MSIRLIWDHTDHSILQLVYPEDWTINDFHRAVDESHHYLRQVVGNVHLIHDMSRCATVPNGFFAALGHVEATIPTNHNLTLVVTDSRFIQNALKFARKIAPRATQRLQLVASLEEAYLMIARYEAQQTVHR